MVLWSNLCPLRVNGGVVHGRGFESLTFGGQWWRVHGHDGFELPFGGPVDRGVVHGRGYESLNFGVNGGVLHGRGFESDFLGSIVG
jgi:hypothetical protein